jgi:hypothetical protein
VPFVKTRDKGIPHQDIKSILTLRKPPPPNPSTTPPTEFRKATVSAALLTGSLDISHAHVSQVHLEFAEKGLSEWKVSGVGDTCGDIDMVSLPLVEELVKQKLVSPYQLRTPIALGSVSTTHALTITHAVKLPVRVHDVLYHHTFAVANMPSPPHLIFGRPWLKKYSPDALAIIDQLGIQTIGPEPSLTKHGLPTPINSPPLTPKTTAHNQQSLPEPPPFALPPCSNPEIAFSGGGDNPLLAAIESEEHRRNHAFEQHTTCLRTYQNVEHLLHSRHLDARVLASAATGTTDPGIRGLTGNKEGWFETIPPEYQHFADTIFSDAAANELPPFRPSDDCVIKLREGAKLRSSKLYDMSKEELEHLKSLLDLELKRGFIRPSKSSSSAPVFFVRDPSSGTRSGQLRLVVDFRDLNANIEQDEYPIPLTRTVMNDLAGATWITSMDVRSGFSNLRVAPGSEKHTAFKTFYGLYEYTVMPMGLSTAPAIFQRFINSVLNPYLGIFCHAYLDDVVIYTKGSLEEHKAQVLQVLQALNENGLRLKPQKCKWFKKECDFLGFTVVCGKGIRMSDDKIQGIRDMEKPRHLSDLRSFLGVVGFYDKFIPHYSDTVTCLTNLTKKDVPFDWTPQCQEAFLKILSCIRNDIFLRDFDHSRETRLSTDSSDAAYAGIIEQRYPDGWFPCLLFHHKFGGHEKGWDIHDKELYAIVHAFDKYRHILAQTGSPIKVMTDHRNLAKFMFTTNLLKSHDGRLGRWWEILSQSNFQIQYLPGVENVFPDFLSRYGFEASTDPAPKVLLPKSRFCAKALADIESWFKKSSTSPNIRKLLEEKFAKGQNQNSSPDPVSDTLTPASSKYTSSLPQSRVIPGSLDARRAKLLSSLSRKNPYTGTSLSLIVHQGPNTRCGPDRRGLGFTTPGIVAEPAPLPSRRGSL